MAISSLNSITTPVSSRSSVTGSGSRATASDTAPATEESAEVTLSEASRSAAESSGASGEVDQARVQSIVNAIRNGEYSVDVSKVDDGLIADVREMLK